MAPPATHAARGYQRQGDLPRGQGGADGPAERALRVLVNAVSARTGGGRTYALEQLRALAGVDWLEVTVFASHDLARGLQGAGANLTVRAVRNRRLVRRVLWEQLVLPRHAASLDVVYLLGNFALFASSRPQVVTFQNPHHFGAQARRVRRRFFPARVRLRLLVESFLARASVKRARVAVAISRSLYSSIVEDLGEVETLRVVLSATPTLPGEPTGPPGKDRYALVVANDYPHKDWDGLIDCFLLSENLPRLKIVGRARSARRERELRARLASAPTRVALLGAIEDRHELARLYSGAACYIAHSHLEAFPLTPFEAMSRGVPVVASDIPPHREICGAAASYYPPDQPDLLAAALERLDSEGSPQASPAPEYLSRDWSDNATEVAAALRLASGDRS